MKLHPRVSRPLVDRVKQFEGLRGRSAPLDDGRYTVGYGHTRSARADVAVTPEDAEALLYYDLSITASALEALCFTPLSKHQFEALVAFAFNIGLENFRKSIVLALVNEGRLLEAAQSMEAWRQGSLEGRLLVMDALVRRRASEKALFLTPAQGFTPTPTPVVPPRLDPEFHCGFEGPPPSNPSPGVPQTPQGGSTGAVAVGAESLRFDTLVRRLNGADAAPAPLAQPGPFDAEAEAPPVEAVSPPLPPALAPFGETGVPREEPRRVQPRRRAEPRQRTDSRQGAQAMERSPMDPPLATAYVLLIVGLFGLIYGVVETIFGAAWLGALFVGVVGILLATAAGGYVLRRRSARVGVRSVA